MTTSATTPASTPTPGSTPASPASGGSSGTPGSTSSGGSPIMTNSLANTTRNVHLTRLNSSISSFRWQLWNTWNACQPTLHFRHPALSTRGSSGTPIPLQSGSPTDNTAHSGSPPQPSATPVSRSVGNSDTWVHFKSRVASQTFGSRTQSNSANQWHFLLQSSQVTGVSSPGTPARTTGHWVAHRCNSCYASCKNTRLPDAPRPASGKVLTPHSGVQLHNAASLLNDNLSATTPASTLSPGGSTQLSSVKLLGPLGTHGPSTSGIHDSGALETSLRINLHTANAPQPAIRPAESPSLSGHDTPGA
ncbi:hypothetical protein HNY73_010487 [Argiope bruennichi]|uniref:Uncharacterized protein n=1 Tax=Argiope bruennichi TaxID=94029 RepID=A0A8T0F7A3_ARGBR|nr:hypothetical protein HNY73_010487 [Argiope bruennichi]